MLFQDVQGGAWLLLDAQCAIVAVDVDVSSEVDRKGMKMIKWSFSKDGTPPAEMRHIVAFWCLQTLLRERFSPLASTSPIQINKKVVLVLPSPRRPAVAFRLQPSQWGLQHDQVLKHPLWLWWSSPHGGLGGLFLGWECLPCFTFWNIPHVLIPTLGWVKLGHSKL